LTAAERRTGGNAVFNLTARLRNSSHVPRRAGARAGTPVRRRRSFSAASEERFAAVVSTSFSPLFKLFYFVEFKVDSVFSSAGILPVFILRYFKIILLKI